MQKIKGLMFDIGGVLYVGDVPIQGANETLNTLRNYFPMRFITNTTRRTPATILHKLETMQFSLQPDELFTALDATKAFLSRHQAKAYTILTDEAKAYFSEFHSNQADFVVVGDAHLNFDYTHLNGAFRALEQGAGLIAAAKNRYFLDSDGSRSMDAGGFIAALEYAANCEATIIGKPSQAFFHLVADSMQLLPDEILMIGDDIESDIKGAQDAGLKAALVKTGKFHPDDLHKNIKPDFILDDVTQLSSIFNI